MILKRFKAILSAEQIYLPEPGIFSNFAVNKLFNSLPVSVITRH
jgi:hypothetical protein